MSHPNLKCGQANSQSELKSPYSELSENSDDDSRICLKKDSKVETCSHLVRAAEAKNVDKHHKKAKDLCQKGQSNKKQCCKMLEIIESSCGEKQNRRI
jgi:hypothetical protein